MTNEPKSMTRYLAVAFAVVVPVLAFISSHVETKVAPVSSYVAQVYGVQAPTQVAAATATPTQP